MKVVIPNNNNGVQKRHIILPLKGTTAKPLDKYNSKSFDLSTDPGKANAPTYKMTARVLDGSEDLRTKIEWMRDTKVILAGCDAKDVEPRKNLIKAVTSARMYGVFIASLGQLAQRRFDEVEMPAALCYGQIKQ